MEKIPTQRWGAVPRAANLATLLVLATATWWSGAQRPAEQSAAPSGASAQAAAAVTVPRAAALAKADTSAGWPAQVDVSTPASLQAVGFQARATR